ncbi:MAG TPA: stage II sporulation protein M [Meiothermus sp.]|nr:stage II sporulation protein M [Meiothermus sp.]
MTMLNAERGTLSAKCESCLRPTTALLALLLTLILGFSSTALAQGAAVEQARQAVRDWQAGKYNTDPAQAIGKPLDEQLKILERAFAFSPVPRGLEVNLDQPEYAQSPDGTTVVRFPATVGGQGGNVQVSLRGNQVTGIGWVSDASLIPAWISSPMAWWAFLGLSLLWLALLFLPGRLRGLWQEGWALVRQYGGLYLGINVGLYGLFALGSFTAYASPQVAMLVQKLVGGALQQVGLGGLLSAGPLEVALVIFFWNFTRGLLLTTALPALAWGVPALLLNGLRYFFFGLALSPALFPAGRYLFHLPTLIIELQAYILVTFGGMVLLSKVLRREGYRAGLRALALTVYLGAFFLVVGAFYEAYSLIYLMR